MTNAIDKQEAMPSTATVYVVDDDPSVRVATEDLLRSMGMNVVAYGCAADYIAGRRADTVSCLLLDVNLPDVSGLELQRRLDRELHPPIVFISGKGDIPSTVQAMKAGAIDFLPKPFSDVELLNAVRSALEKHQHMLDQQRDADALLERHRKLTPREREVFELVVTGLLNKQAAARLGISEVTYQIHRGQVMRKMEATSFAELVRMAVRLGMNHASR